MPVSQRAATCFILSYIRLLWANAVTALIPEFNPFSPRAHQSEAHRRTEIHAVAQRFVDLLCEQRPELRNCI